MCRAYIASDDVAKSTFLLSIFCQKCRFQSFNLFHRRPSWADAVKRFICSSHRHLIKQTEYAFENARPTASPVWRLPMSSNHCFEFEFPTQIYKTIKQPSNKESKKSGVCSLFTLGLGLNSIHKSPAYLSASVTR